MQQYSHPGRHNAVYCLHTCVPTHSFGNIKKLQFRGVWDTFRNPWLLKFLDPWLHRTAVQQPPGARCNRGTLAISGGSGIPGVDVVADAHPTCDPQPWWCHGPCILGCPWFCSGSQLLREAETEHRFPQWKHPGSWGPGSIFPGLLLCRREIRVLQPVNKACWHSHKPSYREQVC